MSRRVGLGRHGGIADESGDPLDGLVNLFDVGIVLAVAFLVAGLGLAADDPARNAVKRPGATARTTTVPAATPGPATSGRGSPLGTLYRLDDGSLVVVQADGSRTPVTP